MPDPWLTLQLDGQHGEISAEAFLDVFRDTLGSLKEVNRSSSEFGTDNIRWRISDAGHSSPLFATLRADPKHQAEAAIVVAAYVAGVQHLSQSNTCPPFFTKKSLELTARLVRTFAAGITAIDFKTERESARVTHRVAENATYAVRVLEHEELRQSGQYSEYGTVEGTLQQLEGQATQDKIVVVDELTNRKIKCYFKGERFESIVRQYWKKRVGVSGRMTVDISTGEPTRIDVEDIYSLGGTDEQIEDVRIDITGGVESSEYVRGLRDDE